MRGRVDGLIVMAPTSRRRGVCYRASRAELRPSSSTLGRRWAAGPAIRLDNAAGARAVVDHLVEIGRRRIVHIAGPLGNIDAEERAAAFTLAAARHPDVQSEVVQGNFYEESGRTAVAALIAKGDRFDAIFAGNDMMAIGALDALRGSGLRVPEDVAVAGFDDVPLASHLGLTTVRVRIAELGERAIGRLIAMLEGGEDGGTELHEPELVVRASTVAQAPAVDRTRSPPAARWIVAVVGRLGLSCARR